VSCQTLMPASLFFLLLFVSVALQRSDLRLAYVTHNNFFYYSCSQVPQPCSVASLTDCRCILLSPVFRMRRLTVWFTSPLRMAPLLNNSEVRHLTLVHCGAEESSSSSLEGYFAVQHLERLTVVNLQQRPVHYCPDVNRAKNTDSNMDPDRDNGAYLDTNRYNRDRDANLDLATDTKRDSLVASSMLGGFPDVYVDNSFTVYQPVRAKYVH
uniref:Uncharacterized protein n=1 Tax=Anabas testudineus TaxID=64144 RepID=A0A3Q1I479_ANATE